MQSSRSFELYERKWEVRKVFVTLVFKEDTLTTALKGKTGGDVLNYQSSTEMIPPG